MYGVGKDKLNYVRSDDNGLTWKAVSKIEFDTVILIHKILKYLFQLKYDLNLDVNECSTTISR